ncbi:MAG: NADH-quinone oxidoreductase subunit M [Verrucomicrobiota bacterium]
MNSILTQIILAPLIAALVALCIPRNYRFIIRTVALIATAVSMVLAVKMFFFDFVIIGNGREQLTQKIPWVTSLGINYHVAVDGLNVGLILMGTIVAFAAVCVSRSIKTYEKEFYILLLVMTGGILGAFASFDLFFFYFFHELALVPTFIMIGVWGRGENKNYATFQITLYLSLGALLALAGLIALYLQLPLDHRTFNIVELTKYFKAQPMTLAAQQFIFPLLLFGFGILVSLWPFHTWAPLGYGSAPTATAMLHAGVLKKFGLYGLLRIALPLMPDAAQSWMHVLAFLCLGNIIHCGFVAMRQRDLNLLIGNSSVAHMGFCFLGIASLSLIGVTGAVTVMIAHGLLAALTFALSGYLYQQTGTLDMGKMGGLLRQIPFIGAALVMAAMAGCGLPGFANFPGEALVLFGSWKVFPFVTALAVWGALVIGAIYMLRAVRNILHGPLVATPLEPRDAISLWRKFPYGLLLASLLLFGFIPSLLTDKIKPTAQAIVEAATGQNQIKRAAKLPVRAALQAVVK